jgi:hypothetical protein
MFLLVPILVLLTTIPLASFSTTDEEEDEENDEEQTSSENEDEDLPESREENGEMDNEQEEVRSVTVDPTTRLITDTQNGFSIKYPESWEVGDIYDAKPGVPIMQGVGRQITIEDPNDPLTELKLLVLPQEVDNYLDYNTMQVKNATLENYTSGRRDSDFLGSTAYNYVTVRELLLEILPS